MKIRLFSIAIALAWIGTGFCADLYPYWVSGKAGFLDARGKVVVSATFDDAGALIEGLAAVEKEGKWGFVDARGRLVIPIKLDSLMPPYFSDGMARFSDSSTGRFGYIDRSGNEVIPPRYRVALNFIEGLAAVSTGEDFIYIDKGGQGVLGPFQDATNFGEGIAIVKRNGAFGAIDRRGEMVISPTFKGIGRFSEGLAPATADGLSWGYINQQGQIVIAPRFIRAKSFVEGLAPAQDDHHQWGYIELDGRTKIPFRFDSADSFRLGMAPVQMGKKWGYIGKDGQWQIRPQFAEAHVLDSSGIGFVTFPEAGTAGTYYLMHLGQMRGYINRRREILWRERLTPPK